jgi:tetratricopeptide (TPR) repeat protein
MLAAWAQTGAATELTPNQRQQMERQAVEASAQGVQLYQEGNLPAARKRLEKALDLYQRIYPRNHYPQGHPHVATGLNNLGFLFQSQGEYAQARSYFQQALDMRQRLYPKERYPQGHPDLAASLNNLAGLLHTQGEYALARTCFQQALDMRQRLYPKERYPDGHAELTPILNNLGNLLKDQGDYAGAQTFYQQALDVCQRLYPKERYPRGHPHLAQSLYNLGSLLKDQGEYARARASFQQALDMRQGLYPKERYPQGHHDLALSLNDLGVLLQSEGEYAQARSYYEQALDVRQRLLPPERYPQGHPHLAHSLNNLGSLLQAQGEYTQARTYYQQSLDMLRQLYPKERYPQGQPQLARGLNNLGVLFQDQGDYSQARSYLDQALDMTKGLYPRESYPQGHRELARSLSNLGLLLQLQGEYAQARAYHQQALEMHQRLYPKERYPHGHPQLAISLSNLSNLLQAQGEYAQAHTYYQQALDMLQRLYPKERYPHGHPQLPTILNNLGLLLQAQGEYVQARTYLQQALDMLQRLYPKERYPQGHPEIASSFGNVGLVLQAQGEYAQAGTYYQQALDMKERLYPKERYPQGHPHLAISLSNLGSLLQAQGEYAQAHSYKQQALEMLQRLYPKERYPHGHPYLAGGLTNLGALFQAQGKYTQARLYADRALDMYQGLAELFVAASSEVEGLNLLASLPLTCDGWLSVTAHLSDLADAGYAPIWRGKAALSRILQRRQQAVRLGADAESRTLLEELFEKRQALSRLLLAPPREPAEHRRRLETLTQRKEDLERQLAQRLPEFRRQQALAHAPHTDLLKQLPPRTTFIDLLRYVRFEQDPKVPGKKGERRTPSYVAFVLRRGQPVRRVDLGAAAPIETAVADWRRAIGDQQASPAAEELARRLWEPLSKHIPAATTTVLLAPDAALSGLPWAALPGRQRGRVLLEEHALAVVPHGAFLLDRLTAPVSAGRKPSDDLLVAVGGVAYDQEAAADKELLAQRTAERGGKALTWPALPGTLRELEQVVAMASKRPVHRLQHQEASSGQLLRELPQARWAHLATHGFFAEPRFRSVLQVDEKAFERLGRDRAAPGARNPLVLSGLVLAGANRAADRPDGGIVTAEAIAALPLQRLELAVLSACETGLGEVAGGEGVFGLQRAFHLAGAHNVIASLWKVDDAATAALMALFYHQLWQEKKSPLEALRQAQLTLYHHAERIPALAKARGFEFDEIVKLPATPKADPAATKGKAPVKVWAAFVLSGLGR